MRTALLILLSLLLSVGTAFGQSNEASIIQTDDENTITVRQDGTARNTAMVPQESGGNRATVMQNGTGNTATVTQQ